METEIENKVNLILKSIRERSYTSLITNTVNIIHSVDSENNSSVDFWNLMCHKLNFTNFKPEYNYVPKH